MLLCACVDPAMRVIRAPYALEDKCFRSSGLAPRGGWMIPRRVEPGLRPRMVYGVR